MVFHHKIRIDIGNEPDRRRKFFVDLGDHKPRPESREHGIKHVKIVAVDIQAEYSEIASTPYEARRRRYFPGRP